MKLRIIKQSKLLFSFLSKLNDNQLLQIGDLMLFMFHLEICYSILGQNS
jgi:hypothetical protein